MENIDTIDEIRLANLRLLIEECEAVVIGKKTYRAGTATALARKCQTSESYLSQILIHFPNTNGTVRTVGNSLARKLEQGMGKPVGWMDVKHDDVDPMENQLRLLYAGMNEAAQKALLDKAILLSKTGKK
jgi:hypothetical protein